MALQKRALVDVKVPIGDADGEVAERVGRHVDAAGKKTVALHRRESAIVANDLSDRIRRRHVASSSAIVRDARRTYGPGWSRVGSQLAGATLLGKRLTSASGAEPLVVVKGHSRTLGHSTFTTRRRPNVC